MEYVVASLILLAVLIVGAVGLVVPRLRRRELPPPGETRAGTTTLERPPAVPETEALPPLIERPAELAAPEAPVLEKPEPTAGRLVRLRARLSR
jgi:fused signal recognition particle receptor